MPDHETIRLFCSELIDVSLALSLSISMAAFAAWIVAVLYRSASDLK
jgi:hypothetical protein